MNIIHLESESDKLNFRTVNKYKTKEQLNDIYQLDITQTVDLNMSDVTTFKICGVCEQKKYLPHTRGFFPSPGNDNFTVAHSIQYFGDGHRAFHAVLINKDMYRLFEKAGVNGISFIPCGLI
jgi:hypothetical protein